MPSTKRRGEAPSRTRTPSAMRRCRFQCSSAAPTVAPYADLQLIFTVESLPITLSGHCDDDPDEPGEPLFTHAGTTC